MTSTPSRFNDGVAHFADVFGPAVEAGLLFKILIDLEAELGGNHNAVPHWLQRFADHLLIREGTVDLGGVEEGDAALHGRADERDPVVPGDRSGVAGVQAHAAEAEGGDFEATVSKLACFHDISFQGLRCF